MAAAAEAHDAQQGGCLPRLMLMMLALASALPPWLMFMILASMTDAHDARFVWLEVTAGG